MLETYQKEILKEIKGVLTYKDFEVEEKNGSIIVKGLNRMTNEEAFNLMENFCYIIADEYKINNKVHFFENKENTLKLSFLN
jgi:hypothetical protein